MHTSVSVKIEPFDCKLTSNTYSRWKRWLDHFEGLVTLNSYTDDQKFIALFFFGGDRLKKIYTKQPEDATEEAKISKKQTPTDYDKAVIRLNKYFRPQINTTIEIAKFHRAIQQPDETIANYVARLQDLTEHCEFGGLTDHMIKNHVIETCRSSELRRIFLREEPDDLEELLDLGESYDAAEEHSKFLETKLNQQLNNNEEINSINAINKYRKNNYNNRNKFNNFNTKHRFHIPNTTKQSQRKPLTCYHCGGSYPHQTKCPAIGKTCLFCGKMDHFSNVCLSKARSSRDNNSRVNNITAEIQDESIAIPKKEDELFAISSTTSTPTLIVFINDTPVNMKIDTGASVNILDEATYNALKPIPQLRERHTPIYSYNSSQALPVLGTFNTTLRYKNHTAQAEFVVIKGSSGNLLSYKSCTELELIKIVHDNDIADIDDTDKSIDNLSNTADFWNKKYPTVFTDKIGKLKNYQLSLHIDTSVKPVQAKPRLVAINLEPLVQKELQNLSDQDIVERVVGQPSEWLSETVNILKKDTNTVRICLDMKAANKAIKREPYQMPNVETIIAKARGMEYFNKIDLRSAFQQIELHPDSRYISRFRCRDNIYQYKRLFFGVNAAPEIFHNKLRHELSDLPGVENAIDDILVMGRTQEESTQNVNRVLQRLSQLGLTVNASKCLFDQTELTFFNLKLSKNGISLNDQKTQALKDFKAPKNAKELHSFLGLVNYFKSK